MHGDVRWMQVVEEHRADSLTGGIPCRQQNQSSAVSSKHVLCQNLT